MRSVKVYGVYCRAATWWHTACHVGFVGRAATKRSARKLVLMWPYTVVDVPRDGDVRGSYRDFSGVFPESLSCRYVFSTSASALADALG